MNKLSKPTPNINQAVAILRDGGLIALPTETVYGLGADARNPKAVASIFTVKGRPSNHPLIVHIADAGELTKWAKNIPETAWLLAKAFWPGPLTLILQRLEGVPDEVTGGLDTIALRVPNHPLALALLSAFGGGIAAPSANRYGRVSPTSAQDVREELGDSVGMVLDGGRCSIGIESTIIDLSTSQVRILRPGKITEQAIVDVLSSSVTKASDMPISYPGNKPSHYAPQAQVILSSQESAVKLVNEWHNRGLRVGLLASHRLAGLPKNVTLLSFSGSIEEQAHKLYQRLREADHLNLEVLVAVMPEAVGVGHALCDRLRRAAGLGDESIIRDKISHNLGEHTMKNEQRYNLKEEDKLVFTRPDDLHLHIRDGKTMHTVLPDTAQQFARAIIMPNLKPPVCTVEDAYSYRERILAALPIGLNFEPLMTLYLTDNTSPEEIINAKECGFIHAVKYYPAGATTNSASGVTDLFHCTDVFATMEEMGMPLLMHGEVMDSEIDIFDREAVFIERHLRPIIEHFPRLKIVLEHITTSEAVEFVYSAPENVAATITVHHLLLNRNAMFSGGIRPHVFCLPILKRERHRQALVAAATSGNPKFFLGTDSAPHARHDKESACGCAGIYTAHAAIELYAEVFEAVGALDKLEAFASFHGADFYGMSRNRDKITLLKKSWIVPDEIMLDTDTLVPLRAGQTIAWRLANRQSQH